MQDVLIVWDSTHNSVHSMYLKDRYLALPMMSHSARRPTKIWTCTTEKEYVALFVRFGAVNAILRSGGQCMCVLVCAHALLLSVNSCTRKPVK